MSESQGDRAFYQGERIMSTSSHFAYLIEEIRNSWSLLRMVLATDSGVYYPQRYYYSPSNLDAFALGFLWHDAANSPHSRKGEFCLAP